MGHERQVKKKKSQTPKISIHEKGTNIVTFPQQALEYPQHATADDIMALQRTIGNQAVLQLLREQSDSEVSRVPPESIQRQPPPLPPRLSKEERQRIMDGKPALPPRLSKEERQRIMDGKPALPPRLSKEERQRIMDGKPALPPRLSKEERQRIMGGGKPTLPPRPSRENRKRILDKGKPALPPRLSVEQKKALWNQESFQNLSPEEKQQLMVLQSRRGGFGTSPSKGDVIEPESGWDKGENFGETTSEGTEIGKDVLELPGDLLGSLGDDDVTSFVGEDAKGTLGSVGDGLGIGVSGAETFMGLISMAINLKKLIGGIKDGDTKAILTALGLGTASTLETGASGLEGVQTIVKMSVNAPKGGVGEKVIETVGSSLGIVKSTVGVVKNGVASVLNIYKMFKAIKDKDVSADTFLNPIQSVFDTIKDGLGAVKPILEILKVFDVVGGSAVVIVGTAISIVTNVIDLISQGINLVKTIVTAVKDALSMNKLKKLMSRSKDKLTGAKLRVAKFIKENITKRQKRGALNITAESTKLVGVLGMIAGKITELVGEISAPATLGIVKGVGMGISIGSGIVKLGGSMMQFGAKILRGIKQMGRNIAQKIETKYPNFARKVGWNKWFGTGGRIFNTDKTTAKKNERYYQRTADMLKMISELPPEYKNNVQEYQDMMTLLETTGVNTKKFFKETDVKEQAKMLVEAFKKRE
jgi:hypothetical protein